MNSVSHPIVHIATAFRLLTTGQRLLKLRSMLKERQKARAAILHTKYHLYHVKQTKVLACLGSRRGRFPHRVVFFFANTPCSYVASVNASKASAARFVSPRHEKRGSSISCPSITRQSAAGTYMPPFAGPWSEYEKCRLRGGKKKTWLTNVKAVLRTCRQDCDCWLQV